MSECFEFSSSMTGSTNTGPLQPQKDSSPLPAQLSPFDLYTTPESPSRRGHRQRHPRKMTLTSPNGQPIQLTPLWEHVVRTRKFPNEVDTRLTFLEISERLRDPEWEVRQHALRVLIDVLPTLNADIVDKVMQPVVPELVNNLGHPAPAVRKGALDALRVFLIHSRDRENTIKRILQDGLNRSEVRDSFQTNVTTGVILSVPSLLFPSSSSSLPSTKLVKDATIALASRLAQVPHQEAVLKSLMKIRDAVGVEDFEGYLEDYDNKLKRNIEILSKIYNIKSGKKPQKKANNADDRSIEKTGKDLEHRKWEESDSDTSGIVEEEDEVNNSAMPAARVVLETEIKFNEETAITMTILEEKEDSENEQDDESGTDVRNEAENKDSSPDRRKTPRRVHFGGEVVKLRTPDSDETESIEATPKTRIPVPVSPATKMPNTLNRPSSQPCSPRREVGKPRRAARSVSSSPKREIYTHNAELSPKKSILARTSSPVVVRSAESRRRRNVNRLEDKDASELNRDNENPSRVFAITEEIEEARKEEVKLVQSGQSIGMLAVNNWINSENRDEEQNEIVVSEIAGNTSKISRESEDSSGRNKKEMKEERNYRERKNGSHNKVVENDQKKIVDEKVPFVESVQKIDHFFGSLVEDDETEYGHDQVGQSTANDWSFNENEVLEDNGMNGATKEDNVNGERTTEGDRDKTVASTIEKNGGNAVRATGELENVSEEPSWEDLGLVDQEVLEDLHNKEDWRARVRGLERVASALRTSSALIAIEPRLGSLLHAVLGCERSCRVAAAGLAVAKVVITGVSEESLKERLPQLAWGLARQGGPCAAQLARLTMLRLRPTLLLEQLLQPQCLNARNAKTRENTLQLLIFSLVTFPSTEFKVDTVANKVAKMVRDRRRRVRQAALDTLAVLAQIYESEEVLAAGKRASGGHHDGEAMVAAIRARLARKSLPLVSADGLVMYGLQISPTVQIATGPDVDWIVAGSGSVSPGIGRTKGQVIATRTEKEKLARSENAKSSENPWIDRPNFVALGVGMRSRTDHPVVWQMVPTPNQNLQNEESLESTREVNTNYCNGEGSSYDLNSRNRSRLPAASRESKNYRNIVEENFDQQELDDKTESRIPVLFPRDRAAKVGYALDKSISLESINSKKRLKEAVEHAKNMNSREANVRSCGTMFRRKKNQQENSTNTSHDTFSPIKPVSSVNRDNSNLSDNSSQDYLDVTARIYRKYLAKGRGSKRSDNTSNFTRSNSTESHQSSLPKGVQQQTFIMHDMYNTVNRRQGRFADENSFRPLQTAPAPPTQPYNKFLDSNQRDGEIDDSNTLSRPRFYSRTKDAAAQKMNDVELISSDTQTGDLFPAIRVNASYRRRLRSLSPSQLYRRQQFPRMASNEVHTMSMHDIDKAVNEEEYNEKNKHHFLLEERYQVQALNTCETQFEADDQELSSSDALENNEQNSGQDVRDTREDSESRSSSPERPNMDLAFDVITGQSSPPGVDTVDFIIALDKKIESAIGPTITPVDDEGSKGWSSEEESKSRRQSRSCSRNSEHYTEFHEENRDESECSGSDEAPKTEDGTMSAGLRSIVSVLSGERILTSESLQTTEFQEISITQTSPLRRSSSPKKQSRPPSRNSVEFEALKSPRRNSRSSSRKLSFNLDDKELPDSEERLISSIVQCDDESFETVETIRSGRESKTLDSPTIIIASKPHSSEVTNFVENRIEIAIQMDENDDDENGRRFVSEFNESNESNESNTAEEGQGRDSSSETNTEPGILKIETEPIEPVARPRRMPSKVPRPTRRYRSNGRGTSDKMKPVVQQCFTELESKEWEVVIKGLKTLSHVTKNQPEYLDIGVAATVNRLLGQQIKNLRSQVARTACTTACDVFSSRIRGIDQDFEHIAGPLLHRTADTNRFLRADCNAALDRMIEHLPPHKTIGVIVQRGAGHQNAIVRAATARLLASIVDRIGPEHTMILPRDVRDKLLNTGARLLIDGNLDARNHAKRMFRRLMRCEGFQKALTEAVPETTLRHIDKTLKNL
ncbi:PREDICTED: uncharacterized protein LOC107192087 [Dufourea novaeangliae]|uniref:uncharacterized protein LOC107192087 n=1 Tax=Dufourea novaeangliae TaxID=178035 RepID=UPI000767C7DE|nr:PREDICTED: uncharacterized protein LOC107192087 [Dufourea novaeangliae]